MYTSHKPSYISYTYYTYVHNDLTLKIHSTSRLASCCELWAGRGTVVACFFKGCVVSNALRISEKHNWLVVSTPLKNISQWEGLSHILWKIKVTFETTNQTIMCSCDLNWTKCRTSLCSRVFPTGWGLFPRLFDAMEIGHFRKKPRIKTLDSFENKLEKGDLHPSTATRYWTCRYWTHEIRWLNLLV